mmetsp:Transcript_30669/g.97921  ORF Transcript_30669/g.97921 Transcript_30669/m.97921 type:complete len:231 (-) Transcript_30669:560-1252(-)
MPWMTSRPGRNHPYGERCSLRYGQNKSVPSAPTVTIVLRCSRKPTASTGPVCPTNSSRESSEGAHAGRSVSAPPLRPPPRLARAAAAAFAPDPPAGSATGSPPSPASGRPSPSGAACTVRSAPGLFILTHSPPRSATTAHGWLPSRVKLGWKAHATGRSCARSIPPLVLCGPALRTRSMSWAHRNLPMVECTSAAATAEAPSVTSRLPSGVLSCGKKSCLCVTHRCRCGT